ncbi:MAG: SCE4755 family polysaccharide monooxygenase-like protein [Myxococcota bacterium]
MTRALALTLLLAGTQALAHIKLTSPTSWQVTDSLGNPQKVGPCGEAGTASNVVTTVEAGSQLSVEWTDTIFHPGHYRISIAPDMNDILTPTPVVMMNDCKSAPIESTPVLPTVADGVFPHTTGSSGMTRSYSITVPMMSCDDCTLQLMQFMSAHTPPCFYFQCAKLRIVMPDAGQPDAGVADAGQPDAGSQPDAGVDAGQGSDAGVTPQPDAGGSADGGTEPTTSGGCGCSTPSELSALGLVVAAFMLFTRRRRA